MSTVLLLRGLDTKASAEDVRSFFGEIHIPDGGIFIIGGALGEAFIAFNSEEDGMLAIQQSGHFLKDSKVELHMSSMVEAEHKFDAYLKRKKPKPRASKRARSASSHTLPVQVKAATDSWSGSTSSDTAGEQTANSNAFLLGVCSFLQGIATSQAKASTCDSPVEPPLLSTPIPGFIRMFGLPSTTTKQEVCNFFEGLSVEEVILNVKLGVNYGCLVKFESFQDATEALSFNLRSLGSACVEVRTATEKMWISALQEQEEGLTLDQGPLKDTVNYTEWPRRKHNFDSIHNPSKKYKKNQTTNSSDNVEYIVMVSHLPVNIVKTEIKELFGCPNIAHSNVLHLLDFEGNRTDKVFIKFDKQEDYDYAVNLSGCHVGSNSIEVSPITEEEMTKMMSRNKPSRQNAWTKKPHLNGKKDNKDVQWQEEDANCRRCLYIRNMPADVRRSQIKALFTENKLKEDDITLLYNSNGACIGEAVVQFQSQTNAALALMHHGRDFLGSKIILTPISVKQMRSILSDS